MAIYGTVYTTTSTSGGWGNQPYMRRLWYAAGLYWAFYGDDTNLYFRTSADGSTWSSSTVITSSATIKQSSHLATWVGGTTLHYATGGARYMYYRQGTLNSDGTITWADAEQTAYDSASATWPARPHGIVLDNSGYAYIVFYTESGINSYQKVTSADVSGGVWTVRDGFPYDLK